MPERSATGLYRTVYTLLLRLYPKHYRERFQEQMDQTFGDLCRERTAEGKGLFTFMLWIFGDTFVGMVSTRISYFFSLLIMHHKHILRPLLGTLCLLVIPLLGNRYVEGWNWTAFDFVWAGTLLFLVGCCLEMAFRTVASTTYKAGAALGILTVLALVWINGAVGIIGEDNGTNLLYLAVLLIGFVGVMASGFKAQGLANALWTIAALQFLIPFVAFFFWRSAFSEPPGLARIFILNTVFSLLFAASGLLFLNAASAKPQASPSAGR